MARDHVDGAEQCFVSFVSDTVSIGMFGMEELEPCAGAPRRATAADNLLAPPPTFLDCNFRLMIKKGHQKYFEDRTFFRELLKTNLLTANAAPPPSNFLGDRRHAAAPKIVRRAAADTMTSAQGFRRNPLCFIRFIRASILSLFCTLANPYHAGDAYMALDRVVAWATR